eukprot:1054902-Pyramimonas_sp.AAC.1
MSSLGSQIRWVPHGRMAADSFTKADPSKGNLALSDLLRTGTICSIDEENLMSERALNSSLKS